MKNLAIILSLFITSYSAYSVNVGDLLDRKVIKENITDALLKLDINTKVDIGSIDLIDGINLSSNYVYTVEPSYQDKYFTRIDSWNLKTNINAGTILKGKLQAPFSFNISKDNNFVFVRQFQSKIKAMNAIPYAFNKLPLTAEKALKLNIGDFVSIPATLNLAFGAGVSTTLPMGASVINGGINSFFVVSGDYTIQVFKLDDKHVRLKIISNRALNGGLTSNIGAQLNIIGFKVFASTNADGVPQGFGASVDNQLKRQTINFVDRIVDREFFTFGINYSPGASYITDYIFDLTDPEAILAYEQILASSYKLKDVVVMDKFLDARDLKDKLLTTTERADSIIEKEINLPQDKKSIIKIFQGFNNYISHARSIKLGILFASYKHNTSYVENKLSFIDKNNHTVEFFYPTLSKYFETNIGKWLFNLKDQANKLFFGLIPKHESENTDSKNPDLGLTFERKDKIFTHSEQKSVTKYLINQLPNKVLERIDFSEWKNGNKKIDSRIYFQLILKSQGFNYLRKYTKEEIVTKLVEYLNEKRLTNIIIDPKEIDTSLKNNDDDNTEINNNTIKEGNMSQAEINKLLDQTQVKTVATILYKALHDASNVSSDTLTKLLKINEIPLFNHVGMGFLISLIPEENLENYIYLKLEMSAAEIDPVKFDFGTLNYKALYNEINAIQSRLSNRSYDLRISPEDIEMENTDANNLILNDNSN